MTRFPPFTDLGALADDLAKRGDVQLRALISQAWKANSCTADLRQAVDCAGVLREMINRPREDDTPRLLATERALMTTIILLYARATSTNGHGGERGPIQLDRKKLSDDEWADHCAILDVRNQAMAHVYASRKLGAHEWHREKFFAIQLDNGAWKPASATNQTGFHAQTLDRLERMLPVAAQIVQGKFHALMKRVTDHINRDVKAATLLKHIFDPRPVFGGDDAVRLLLSSAEAGAASFWVNEGNRNGGDLTVDTVGPGLD